MISQREYSNLKRRLTTLENRLKRTMDNYAVPILRNDDPRIPIYRAISEECFHAWEVFEREGYPDNWARWRIAADDAAWQLGMYYRVEGSP